MYDIKPWLLTVLLVVTAGLEASSRDGRQPVPSGAKVTLEADKTEYFLGESVLLHFILRNTGTELFNYSIGGDSRAVNRHMRFKFHIFDAAGNELAPLPEEMHFGGPLGIRTMEAGDSATFSLPLFRYCHIDKPGAYTFRVHHDFGWNETQGEYPYAEIKLTFKMPDGSSWPMSLEEQNQSRAAAGK